MRKRIFVVLGGCVGSYLLHFPLRLLEDIMMGWIGEGIETHWQTFLSVFVVWILPFIIVFGAIWLGYWLRKPKDSKGKASLKVMVNNVKIDSSPQNDKVLFLVNMTLEPLNPIQLGKLDFVYKPSDLVRSVSYPPLGGLPTTLVKGIESYEVKYEVAGFIGDLRIESGFHELRKDPGSKWPQGYIHVMAGGLDFNTNSFPVPTPKRQSSPDIGGSQT